MPVDIQKQNGVTRRDTAERFQINPLPPDEDIEKMQLEAFFNVSTLVDGKEVARIWDSQPLIFDCVGDPELRAAMQVIQTRIGQKRYQQIMALDSESTT